MSAANFEAGQTVYSQHGEEAEFVARSGGEYIVRPIYEDDDGEQTGDIVTWSTAFRTPPAPKLDADTAAAEKRLIELKRNVSELESQKYALERSEKDRIDRIKRHEELADLDRYLAGDITHYVATHDYYPTVEIIPVAETVENYHSNSGYGLLKLLPGRGWDKTIRWSVTFRTRDRCERSRTCAVIPCCGEEDAQTKAAELVREMVAAYLGKERKYRSYADQLVTACKRFEVEVPAELTDGIASEKRDAATKRIQEFRDKLLQAEAELALATGAAS